ncbi:hypothetical protein I6H07_06090 [Hafnia alvei]|nr:hypothetical protein [Hafnia alvei]MBI0275404.1 hypothetical protein [Hafnia alvei]PNK98602.1 hypothetical protein CEQ28_013910 [Hafnia alvei]
MPNNLGKFNYGPKPAIIMWQASTDSTPDADDFTVGDAPITSLTDPAEQKTNTQFYAYKFDATVSEKHHASATVTKFPVSNGFIVSDHLIKNNRVLTLKVVATNMVNDETWLMSVDGMAVISGAIFASPIGSLVGSAAALVQTSFETADRIASAYQKFLGFMSNGTKLYINTILGTYTNCIVTDIQTEQDKDTSSIFAALITLEELQVSDPSNDAAAMAAVQDMQEMTDYSKFVKIAESVGLGLISKVAT